jgi:iron complex outermembrane receptor protein
VGELHDASGQALALARIILLPDSLGCLSGPEGQFAFEALPAGTYQLSGSLSGFESDTLTVTLREGQTSQVSMTLLPNQRQLDEVVILDEHAKQEDLLATDHFDATDLARNVRGNFAESLARLPGIDAINTGVGIAKPVIRGLSANRVIVNDQGIKQEGQQWGSDHGLEIDAFSVSRVEVVRGPASLQYGSDGLGGVINLLPAPVPPLNQVSGSLSLLGKSNNAHLGASARLAVNRRDAWVAVRYTHQAFGDYRVPADTFVYQGFVLPIAGGSLKNTAGVEQNLQAQIGLRRKWGITRLTYSRYHLNAGLFAGAVGVPRSYALQPDGNARNIALPSQTVDHQKLIFNQTLICGQDHLTLDLGWQRNLRQERSFPEYHNQPNIEPTNTLGLQLTLDTWTANVHYEQVLSPQWTNTYGLSAEWQTNQRAGWEFLLPAFRTMRSGAFVISHFTPRASRWQWSGGLRLDGATNGSEAFQRYIWDSNARISDSLAVPLTDDRFVNWSGSFGGRYTLRPERAWLKLHLGKSFRVPYPSETVSNGVHHGTFRHEQGTPTLRSEQGYQLDLGVDWQASRWQANLSAYANYFDGFIYLGPSGKLSSLPEAGQIYRYQQTDALYSGFELDWQIRLMKGLTFHQAAAYVWNYNLVTYLSLPFTPQPSLLSELTYTGSPQVARVGEWYATLSHRYAWANGPTRIDRNERPTPAYQLIDAALGITLQWQHVDLDISLQGQNLLNTAYLNHLSRYRLINLPEQGRNWVLLIKVPFGGS